MRTNGQHQSGDRILGLVGRPLRTEQWGGWTLNVDEGTLDLVGEGPDFGLLYAIPLYPDCRTSAGVLDKIFQIVDKKWATRDVLAGLLVALEDVLTPQGTLCPSGHGYEISAEQMREMVQRAAERAT